MRIVFFGTPDISKICLEKLVKENFEIVGVVTGLDKPVGRGNKITQNPVKVFATEHNIPVFQYENVSKEGVEDIKNLKPDLMVVVAFGQILSDEIINIALCINLHGSLLPLLRGASPIQSALLNGFKTTGVTVMKIIKELDAGDMLLQREIEIDEEDNSKTLFEKIAFIGSEALCDAIKLIENGDDVWFPQDNSLATFTQKLTKDNAKLDFSFKTDEIVNKVRAYYPSPMAFFNYGDKTFKVCKVKNVSREIVEKNQNISDNKKIGEIVFSSSKSGLIIKTQDGFIEIISFKPENQGEMLVKAYLNGHKIKEGDVL